MPAVTALVLDEIIAHAKRDAPIEACGYLGEKEGVLDRALPLTNVDGSTEHFGLDPLEQFEAVRAFRADGRRPGAVYHSHPASPARPSAEDIRLSADPALLYLIVSLVTAPPAVKAFRIRNGQVEEEELRVLQGNEV